MSPPAPSSNLAPPTASISSKKMRHAFLVLVKQLNLTQGRKRCFPTWPSQRAHGPSWHLHLHTFAPILTRSPCNTEGCHFTVTKKGFQSPDETGIGPVGDRSRTQGFTSARGAVQQNTLRRLNSKVHKALGVEEGSLHNLEWN